MRVNVFAALSARPGLVSLAQTVGQQRGKRVAANSVYRIIDPFVHTKLANRIESANAYLTKTHRGCRHDCIYSSETIVEQPATWMKTA